MNMNNTNDTPHTVEGFHAKAPLYHVDPPTMQEIADLLLMTTRRPHRCVSKGQLKDCAEKAMAEAYVYQRRCQVMTGALLQFQKQAAKLPEGDPTRAAFEMMFKTMSDILTGRLTVERS